MTLMRRVGAPLSSMALHIVLPSKASVRSRGGELGISVLQRALEVRLAQKRARLLVQRVQDDFLRRCGGLGVSALAASIPARIPDIRPIAGQVQRAAVTLRIDEGLQH